VSRREVFRFLAWAWDVTEGHRRAADYPIRQVNITVLAGFAQLIRVTPEHLDRVDLTRPILIISTVPELAGKLVIDGWHRVHRALRDGLTHLPAWLLTEADEQHIRIRP
jgi:hypothetical protein